MATDIFDGGTPVYPDIAVNPDGSNNDTTDPPSGQPNVSTPASPIPLDGWPGNGIPIFSDFNKIFRLITQWIRYLYSITLTGTFTGSMFEGSVQLPTGFTKDNCVIAGGWIKSGSGAYYCMPLNYSVPNGASYSLVSAKVGNPTGATPDYVRIVSYNNGDTAVDLNGYSYAIVLRKIS